MTPSTTSSAPSGSGTNPPVGDALTTHKEVNPGVLAAEIIGAIVLLALVVFAIVYTRRNRKKTNQPTPASEYNPTHYGGQPAMVYGGPVSSNFTGTSRAYVSTNCPSLPT